MEDRPNYKLYCYGDGPIKMAISAVTPKPSFFRTAEVNNALLKNLGSPEIWGKVQGACRGCPYLMPIYKIRKTTEGWEIAHIFIENLTDAYTYFFKNRIDFSFFTINIQRILLKTLFEAISSLHDVGIIHCDIKPSNIWVHHPPNCAFPTHLILGDYELAAKKGEQPAYYKSISTPMGSEQYAPGEAYNLSTPALVTRDVYSLAITLLQLFTNPKIVDDMFINPSAKDKEINPATQKMVEYRYSKQVLQILMRCTSKDHQERPHDVRALGIELDRALQEIIK